MVYLKPTSEAQGGPGCVPSDQTTTDTEDACDDHLLDEPPPFTEPRSLIFTPFGGTWEVQKVLLARGMCGGMGVLLYYFTLTVLPLGDAVTLFSLYPIVTIVLASIFLREPVRWIHVLATTASFVGAICIARPAFLFGQQQTNNDNSSHWVGYVTAVLGSFCRGSVVTLIRQAGKVGAHTFQLMWSWACFGFLFAMLFATQGWVRRIDGSWSVPTAWWYIVGMGTFGSCAHFLINYAGRLAPAGLGGMVRSSDILWAYMWEIVVFREMPRAATWFGVVLIVISLCMIAVQKFYDERRLAAQSDEHRRLLPSR